MRGFSLYYFRGQGPKMSSQDESQVVGYSPCKLIAVTDAVGNSHQLRLKGKADSRRMTITQGLDTLFDFYDLRGQTLFNFTSRSSNAYELEIVKPHGLEMQYPLPVRETVLPDYKCAFCYLGNLRCNHKANESGTEAANDALPVAANFQINVTPTVTPTANFPSNVTPAVTPIGNVPAISTPFDYQTEKTITAYQCQKGILALPYQFVAVAFQTKRKYYNVIDENGQAYKCKMLKSKRSRNEAYLSDGWQKFCRDHNLIGGERIRLAVRLSELGNIYYTGIP